MGRAKALTFSVNGKGYICSGILYGESTFEDLKDLWEYDPVTNKWTQKAEMPASHTMGIGFTIDKRAFVGLGDSKTIWEYLPDTDSWEYVCAYPGTFLLNGISLVIDGVAYIGMGWNGLGQAVNEFWAYDVTSNEWTQKKDFPGIVRFQPLSYSVNGKGYYGAGHEAFDVWKYNPADNTWEQTVPINTKWIGSTYCFSINGKGYVGSTLESGAPYDDFTSLLRYNE